MSSALSDIDTTRRKVRIEFKVAAPTSFDPKVPLKPSNIINPHSSILLQEEIDTIDPHGLESLRATWVQALESKRDDLAKREARKELEKDNPVLAALDTVTRHLDRQGLAEWVKRAKFPVPDHYVVVLPDEGSNMRTDIIHSLVPFVETRDMLLRLEQKLKLPMRVVTVASAPVSKNEVDLRESERQFAAIVGQYVGLIAKHKPSFN